MYLTLGFLSPLAKKTVLGFVYKKYSTGVLFILTVLYDHFISPQSNWNEIVDSFDEMALRETLLRGIYAYGFEKPSAIQQRAILPCIKGKYKLPKI